MGESIADAAVGLVALLEWDEPIAIAFYSDGAEKEDLIEHARALAAPRDVLVVHRGEEALPLIETNALVIVDPSEPADAVRFLDSNRDRFEGVNARLLLVLLRGGAGEHALADAPQLSSFARSTGFDIAADSTPKDAAAAFQRTHRLSHNEWLQRWRTGEIQDTLENNLVLAEALAIDSRP